MSFNTAKVKNYPNYQVKCKKNVNKYLILLITRYLECYVLTICYCYCIIEQLNTMLIQQLLLNLN